MTLVYHSDTEATHGPRAYLCTIARDGSYLIISEQARENKRSEF